MSNNISKSNGFSNKSNNYNISKFSHLSHNYNTNVKTKNKNDKNEDIKTLRNMLLNSHTKMLNDLNDFEVIKSNQTKTLVYEKNESEINKNNNKVDKNIIDKLDKNIMTNLDENKDNPNKDQNNYFKISYNNCKYIIISTNI